MAVIIGIDPHKATHTAAAISGGEEELARKKVRSGATQAEQLVAWAEPFPARTWAIESAGGLGYLLAQQLVAAGETVVDVPATLASRVRVLSTGRSSKNDPNDALSVAIAALRSRGLRRVDAVGHSEVLRLLAKRNTDIGNHPTRLVCRMHALLTELAVSGTDGRWSWEVLPRSRVDERTYAAAVAEAITTRQRWRHQYDTAKAMRTGARAGPAPPSTSAA